MIKLVHICYLSGGGRERRAAQLIRGIDATNRYEQSVIHFDHEIEYKDALETNAKFYCIDTRNKREIFNEIRSILTQTRPDIVHLWTEEPRQAFPAIILKLKLHYKLIAGSVASSTPVRIWSKDNFSNQILYLWSDAIVSNSKKGLLANHANKQKAHVIYNGFDFSRFGTSSNSELLKNELGITSEKIVLMAARFQPVKDWKTFIDVAQKCQLNNINVKFLAAGDGQTLESSKDYARLLEVNNISFLGHRTDIEKILSICDISMLLSNTQIGSEGLSNTIMESMAAGVPVIATNAGGNPEIITDKQDGFLVCPFDSQEIYNIIQKLTTDEEYHLAISTAAKSTIKNSFLLSQMTTKYDRLYQTLI